ncbi:ABC transporter permease [Candidatus Margulisiibacteriota bacterium]
MIIKLKNLTKYYETGKIKFKALDNINLEIAQNEFVAIMGPSGSGKSTMLHILGLLDKPSQGEFLFCGQSAHDLKDTELAQLRSKHLGFIFQQFHLLPRTSSYRNVALPLLYAGKGEQKNRPQALLAEVGLSSKLENKSNELSGGERQRVAIARSLVNNPEIILADEPTGNLDSVSEAEIMKLLSNLHAQGKTVILITHEESLARNAGRIIRLKDGKIISDQRLKKSKINSDNILLNGAASKIKPLQVWEYIKQAMTMIVSNKIRSFLSMLGILIGVGTVVAMMMLGTGAKVSIEESLMRLGTNMVTIRRNWRINQVPVRFSENEIKIIKRVPYVKRVSPQVGGGVTLIYGNTNMSSTALGTNPAAAEMRNNQPEHGRYFTEKEMKKRDKVAVLGRTIVKELFKGQDPLGKIIKINKHNFRVIGVMPTLGGSHWRDRDNLVVIPITTAMYRLFGKSYYDSIDVQIASDDKIEEVMENIKKAIIKEHNLKGKRREVFRIINMAEIRSTLMATTKNLSFLMSFIASLSLLVGGIGIMNIMLVSVTERTREIGLRKAIGATKRDIMFQFIVEAIMMTFTGGLMGIGIGMALAYSLSAIADWAAIITPLSILLACTFSIGVGLIFGTWPAKKAAGLDPIEALRYE